MATRMATRTYDSPYNSLIITSKRILEIMLKQGMKFPDRVWEEDWVDGKGWASRPVEATDLIRRASHCVQTYKAIDAGIKKLFRLRLERAYQADVDARQL